ncbi:MAG: hypothetical protein ACFE8O_05695 [Candidatus Hermodarchaeota archaeon]
MPVKEIIVLRKGGMPLFNFAPSGAPKLDALVAGFLSAQAGFAEEIGEREIQVVTFAENKFVYESRADLLFIIVIGQEDDEHIYRVIIKEVARAFVSQYSEVLKQSVVSSHLFRGFREYVIEILGKYDRIPEIQRRYPTAILPPEIIDQIEEILSLIEGQPGIMRTALITSDGYVITSKLQQHELGVAGKQVAQSQEMELPGYFTVTQTTFDEGTKLYIYHVSPELMLLAIIREDLHESRCTEIISPLVYGLRNVDYSSMVKIDPKTKLTEVFSDLAVFTTNPILESTLYAEQTKPAREFALLFGNAGFDVIRAIDGVSSVEEIRVRTGVHGRQLAEILSYLAERGYIRRIIFYPKLASSDTRFLAYLETVGLPRDEYQILDQAKGFCDGNNSVADIAQRIGADEEKLITILRKLGDNVEWLT